AAEAGDADGIVGGEAAGGVGEDGVARGIDEVEERLALVVEEALAPDGDGDDTCAAGIKGCLHGGEVAVLAGAEDQAAAEMAGADSESVVGEGRDGDWG